MGKVLIYLFAGKVFGRLIGLVLGSILLLILLSIIWPGLITWSIDYLIFQVSQ